MQKEKLTKYLKHVFFAKTKLLLTLHQRGKPLCSNQSIEKHTALKTHIAYPVSSFTTEAKQHLTLA